MKESDFKDLMFTEGCVKAHVRFSRLLPRYKEAQIWLDNRINLDISPYIPFRTGALQTAVMTQNASRKGTGKLIAYALPYGPWLYKGYHKDGKPIRYTNPLSTPEWFKTVKNIYAPNWIQGVDEIIHRR